MPPPSTASRHRRRGVLLACQRRVTRRATRLALATFQSGVRSYFWSKKVRAQSVKAVENGEPVLPRRTLFWHVGQDAVRSAETACRLALAGDGHVGAGGRRCAFRKLLFGIGD